MEGDVIIPKLIHSNVNLFLSDKGFNKTNSLNMPRPWTVYIASDFKYSILKCLSRFESQQYSDIRNCIFKDLPSYSTFLDFFKHPCPLGRQITSVKQTVFVHHHELSNASRIRFKAARIVISTERCPILISMFRTFVKDAQLGLGVRYNFFTDRALRVNVTFIHFEILKEESVQLLNLADEIKSEKVKSKNHIEVGKISFSKDIKFLKYISAYPVRSFIFSHIGNRL